MYENDKYSWENQIFKKIIRKKSNILLFLRKLNNCKINVKNN